MAWSGAWSAAIFGSLKAVNLLRVDYHTEESGLDKTRHGEVAYPDWVREQYIVKPKERLGAFRAPLPKEIGSVGRQNLFFFNFSFKVIFW